MSTFTQRHYDAVASVIMAEVDHTASLYTARVIPQTNAVARLASLRRASVSLADMFAADNSRFRKGKFLQSCGFEAGGNNVLPRGRRT